MRMLRLAVDAHDGSGALDAQESAEITKKRSKKDNDPATQRGWDIGTLTSANFNNKGDSSFSYNVKIPNRGGSKHVKVALAWNSKRSNEVSDSVLTTDLDIEIYDSKNKRVSISDSYDNSYEIAEFDGDPGKAYKIKIKKYSGNDWSWYGIAWTVA